MVDYESVVKCSLCEKYSPSTNECCDSCGVILISTKALCSNCKNELKRNKKKCKYCKISVNRDPFSSDLNLANLYKEEKNEFIEKFSAECKQKGLDANLETYIAQIKSKLKYYSTVKAYLSENPPLPLLEFYGASVTENLTERIQSILKNLNLYINTLSLLGTSLLQVEIREFIKNLNLILNLVAIRWVDFIHKKNLKENGLLEEILIKPLIKKLVQARGTLQTLIGIEETSRIYLQASLGGSDYYYIHQDSLVKSMIGFEVNDIKKEQELLKTFLTIIGES